MFSQAATTFDGKDQRLGRYDHFIIHVTATPITMKVNDQIIYLMHRRRGFQTTGYQAIIDRQGQWLDYDSGNKLRPIGEQGAHVGDCGRGWNSRSFAVSMVGGVDENNQPENNMSTQQFLTLQRGLRRFLELHPAPQFIKIMGHRDLIKLTGAPPKACPCFDVQTWLDKAFQSANPAMKVKLKDRDEDVKPITQILVPVTYVIKPNDTFWRIGQLLGVSSQQLIERNPTMNSRKLQVGATITV